MRKNKHNDLEYQLKKALIDFEKTAGGYFLWGLRNRTTSMRSTAKKIQNTRIRQTPVDKDAVYRPDRWMWD